MQKQFLFLLLRQRLALVSFDDRRPHYPQMHIYDLGHQMADAQAKRRRRQNRRMLWRRRK